MRALRAHRRGGPDVLVVEDMPRPVPGPGEVLVAVHAAAITFAELDWEATWTREGRDRTPVVLSHELSGVVAENGPGFVAGEEVYALTPFDQDGVAAEYAAVDASLLARKPAGVSHIGAAALSLSGLTAWQALFDHAGLRPGDHVLVHGGAGAVGGFAVQLAVWRGARVTATCRPAQADLLRSLGAETADAPGSVHELLDVVLDTVGGTDLADLAELLRPGGTLVTLAAPPPPGVEADFFVVTPRPDQLAELGRLVDIGRLQVTIARVFPLVDGPAAYASGTKRPRLPGKTVLAVT